MVLMLLGTIRSCSARNAALWVLLRETLVADGVMLGNAVKSGRLRVSELERDVECDLMASDGSDGLCRMLPILSSPEHKHKRVTAQCSAPIVYLFTDFGGFS